MSTLPDPSRGQSESTYLFGVDSAEMARLLDQDKLLTEAMGGLFSEQPDLSNVVDVLDIACGPGGWAQEVAHSNPEMKVTGIDINREMIDYARAYARVRKLENAHFRLMDALKPLDFPDESFDLVNARTIFGFMPPKAWPGLLQECLRILRPGGIIRLTEAEAGFANTRVFERYCGMVSLALHLAGQSFSPNGLHLGITPVLGKLLREAGFQHVRKKAYVVDFSAGEEAHGGFYQDFVIGLKVVQPFMLKMKVTTREEVDVLYQQALDEILSEEFCALWFLLTVWGTKQIS